MLFDTEPEEINIIEAAQYKKPLPEWAEPILDYVARRVLVSADNINQACFSSGNRTGRKKLVQLALGGYLKRYEISACKNHFIAYSLGMEGMRHTRVMAPQVDIVQAQELIIANEFCRANHIEKFTLWTTKSLLIGQVEIKGSIYSLWCPRQTELPRRIKSLHNELPLNSEGLLVVAPNLGFVPALEEYMNGLYIPVYFCEDRALDQFMRLENGVLIPVNKIMLKD